MALLALFALVYSAIAGPVERTWISGPIVFTLCLFQKPLSRKSIASMI